MSMRTRPKVAEYARRCPGQQGQESVRKQIPNCRAVSPPGWLDRRADRHRVKKRTTVSLYTRGRG